MPFTSSHEWIVMEKNVGVVGITSHAQKELGEIVYVELPKMGTVVEMGEAVSVLESTKAAADIYAPVSGKVIAINEKLKEASTLLNQDPEGEGWLFKLELTKPDEYERLLSLSEYQSLIS